MTIFTTAWKLIFNALSEEFLTVNDIKSNCHTNLIVMKSSYPIAYRTPILLLLYNIMACYGGMFAFGGYKHLALSLYMKHQPQLVHLLRPIPGCLLCTLYVGFLMCIGVTL